MGNEAGEGKPTEGVPAVTARAATFADVFDMEIRGYIQERRRRVAEKNSSVAALKLPEKSEQPQPSVGLGLWGLALSGGGIRSATFDLGLVQALSRAGVLPRFDYLSTVSGGGYFGSCLVSLLASGSGGVESEDFPFRFGGQEEREEVKHLRAHANYLAPRYGVLRRDTWRLVSAYLTGLLLTLSTVFLLLVAASCAVIVLYPLAVRIIARLLRNPFPPGHDLWAHPYDHWRAIFFPAFAMFGGWFFLLSVYVMESLRGWTFERRRQLSRLQAAVLRLAALLAVAGAMPFLLNGIDHMRDRTGSAFWATLAASALSLLRSRLIDERAATLAARLKRWTILAGAWAFLTLSCLGVLYLVWTYREEASLLLIASLVLLTLLALIADINRVSLFYFYRDRLSEAYVIQRGGAGSTGILSNDGLGMADSLDRSGRGPYPLINVTANLPGSGNPVLRGRKADFFLLSPYYCGCTTTGYRPTIHYESSRVTLASAMAISGAALNPESGPRTSPAITFLMAILNARLGVWAENPRYDFARFPWLRQARRYWPWYLLREFIGASDESSKVINLSDGGHIENLGIYELLRRRCSLILASDAGADPQCRFGDLGNLIRKARVDLGIQIELKTDDLRPLETTNVSASHAVRGEIHYPSEDGEPQKGILIYVKSSLVQDDPGDLHEYRRGHPTFPHESTTDQFFDEAQFESYRELGYRAGKQAGGLL